MPLAAVDEVDRRAAGAAAARCAALGARHHVDSRRAGDVLRSASAAQRRRARSTTRRCLFARGGEQARSARGGAIDACTTRSSSSRAKCDRRRARMSSDRVLVGVVRRGARVDRGSRRRRAARRGGVARAATRRENGHEDGRREARHVPARPRSLRRRRALGRARAALHAADCVPDVPAWIEGVIEHRGKVIPVVDLRRRVELSDDSITPETRILVLNTATGWVGAIVDMVHEVAMIPATSVSPPPPLFRGLAAEFMRGIAKVRDQLVVVLDVDRVLSSTDRIVFDAIGAGRRGGASWLSERSTSFGRGGRRSTRDSTSRAPPRELDALKARDRRAVQVGRAGDRRAATRCARTCCSSSRSGRASRATAPLGRAAVRRRRSRVVHADHIGASTFIEKGWSKISLGDHAGAEAGARARRCSSRPTIRRPSRCSAGR